MDTTKRVLLITTAVKYSTILFYDAKQTKTLKLRRHLQQAVATHRSVARPVAFVCWSVSKAVAPLFDHVETLGVPNVSLQPNVLPLSAVKLQQQVSVPATSPAALALRLFFLLLRASLEALLMLKGKQNVNVNMSQARTDREFSGKKKKGKKIPNLTALLATSLSLLGSRLVLWLMARLLMCLGRAPKI